MKSFKSYLKETSDARKAKKEANNKRNLQVRLGAVQNNGYSGIKGDTEEALKRKINLAQHGVELYGGGSVNEENTEEEWGGKNTFWSKGKTTITLDQLKKAIEHIPTVKTPTNTLSTNPAWKPTSKIKPDMSHPIYVMDGRILDGNHRVNHAINNNIENVDAKVFTTDDLPKKMRKVFT